MPFQANNSVTLLKILKTPTPTRESHPLPLSFLNSLTGLVKEWRCILYTGCLKPVPGVE